MSARTVSRVAFMVTGISALAALVCWLLAVWNVGGHGSEWTYTGLLAFGFGAGCFLTAIFAAMEAGL